jgi:hypothetical protein
MPRFWLKMSMVNLTNWEGSCDIAMHRKNGILIIRSKLNCYEKDCDDDDSSGGGYGHADGLHK